MYSRRTGLVLGFHGCDKSVRDKIVGTGESLCPSKNDYDWLGNGIYFWENNYLRALQYAELLKSKRNSEIKNPSVIGAVIDLGHCMDLLDATNLELLKKGYNYLKETREKSNLPIPENKPAKGSRDLLLRYLDCSVIETTHSIIEEIGKSPFDTVRAVFFEGKELYPNSGFKEKNHIQISVRNSAMIKGYFLPRV